MKVRWSIYVLVCCALLCLTGCGSNKEAQRSVLRVGVVLYTQDDPFINALTDFLKEDLEDCIISYDRSSGEPDGAPKGYKYVDAARKKDICWDLMKQLTVEEVEKGYQKCVAAFASNDPTGFGPLTKIVEDGIASWGSMIYLKGETLDEFKARKGATDMDQYMISSFAAIDRNGDWLGSGDMGWFGISTNDKEERAWNDELQTLMNEAQDDDFLVVVDCHI